MYHKCLVLTSPALKSRRGLRMAACIAMAGNTRHFSLYAPLASR